MTRQSILSTSASPGYFSDTDDENPFALERYLIRLPRIKSSRKMHVAKTIEAAHTAQITASLAHPLNAPMAIGGRGLNSLAQITEKSEVACERIQREIEAPKNSKFLKCLVPGENRAFIDALYDVEHTIAVSAELVATNPSIFCGINSERIRIGWKATVKAVRDLVHALRRLRLYCGEENYVRKCRKYVIRVLLHVTHHYPKLVFRMEREVERVWAGGFRYGDDVNLVSLLQRQVDEWATVEPTLLDRIMCRKPDFLIRKGASTHAVMNVGYGRC